MQPEQPDQPEQSQSIDTLAITGILVHDKDEALDWYTTTLGFEKRTDETYGSDGQWRWVTVAPKEQTEIEIALETPDPDHHGEERAERMREQIGHESLGAFNTSNIEQAYETLRSRGVTFRTEPTEQSYGTDAIFEDLYGNWGDLVEPR